MRGIVFIVCLSVPAFSVASGWPGLSLRSPGFLPHCRGFEDSAPATPTNTPGIEASKFTLQGDSIPLQEAIKALQKQTGNTVADLREYYGQPVTNPSLRLDLKDVSFWQALDAIAEQANLSADLYTRKSAVGLVARRSGHKPPPTAHSGIFRITLKRLHSVVDFETGNRYASAAMELAWEPRYHPVLLTSAPNSIRITDQKGQTVATQQQSKREMKLLGMQAVELDDIRLPLPPRSAATIKQLEGEFHALVAPKILSFSFEKTDPGQTRKEEEVSVTLKQFRTERDIWTITIQTEYPRGAIDLESYQTWIAERNELAVFENSARLPLNPSQETAVEGTRITTTYRFTGVPEKIGKVSLVYRALAAPVRCPVRFQFRDLPLP